MVGLIKKHIVLRQLYENCYEKDTEQQKHFDILTKNRLAPGFCTFFQRNFVIRPSVWQPAESEPRDGCIASQTLLRIHPLN